MLGVGNGVGNTHAGADGDDITVDATIAGGHMDDGCDGAIAGGNTAIPARPPIDDRRRAAAAAADEPLLLVAAAVAVAVVVAVAAACAIASADVHV